MSDVETPPAPQTLLPRRVLVVGVSTRAIAESAAQAGFTVTAIDAFGDLDQHALVRSLSLPRDFGAPVSATGMAHAARSIECDAVAYLSNFENHPSAVSTLAAGRALWGNAPAVLRRVRDPMLVMRALRRRGSAAPEVSVSSGSSQTSASGQHTSLPVENTDDRMNGSEPLRHESDCRRWLVKPLASGGGHRVRRWHRGMPLPRGCYRQELVEGTPGSVVFVAARGHAVPLGVSRQLIGEHAFGAADYRYCGSILGAAGDPQFARDEAVVDAAYALASTVAEEFGLVGVNGIDFVARDGVAFAIEVNPRWSASMELVERAYGVSVFGAHAAACVSGALPEFDLIRRRNGAAAVGKAVVFARRAAVAGDTRAWLRAEDADAAATVRDIPHPGERIQAGGPICTVFAAGLDAATCHAALVRRAKLVYADLTAWE